jgi:hypothetical protein
VNGVKNLARQENNLNETLKNTSRQAQSLNTVVGQSEPSSPPRLKITDFGANAAITEQKLRIYIQ